MHVCVHACVRACACAELLLVSFFCRLSDASGSLEMTKVAEGEKFERPLLDSNDGTSHEHV